MERFHSRRIRKLSSAPRPAIRAETIRWRKVVPTLFTPGNGQGFHGNDAKNLLECGHPCLQFLHRVFLHEAHSGVASRGSYQIWFIDAAQNGADRVVDRQQLVDSQAALVPSVVAIAAALRPCHAVWWMNPTHGRKTFGVFLRDLLIAMACAQLSKQSLSQNSARR